MAARPISHNCHIAGWTKNAGISSALHRTQNEAPGWNPRLLYSIWMHPTLKAVAALLLAGCHAALPLEPPPGGDLATASDLRAREAGRDAPTGREAGPALEGGPAPEGGPALEGGVANDLSTITVKLPAVLSGPGADALRDVAADPSGNIYIVGSFDGAASLGPLSLTGAGKSDAVVVSLDPGGKLRWVETFGGPLDDRATGVALAGGQVFVTGTYNGTAAFASTSFTSKGSNDVFIVGLDAPSGSLIWSRSVGGSGSDQASDIAADSGRLCVVGYGGEMEDIDGKTHPTAGGVDAFVGCLETTGTQRWFERIGGASTDLGLAAAIDGQGTCTVGGAFNGKVTIGGNTQTANDQDAFLVQLSAAGDILRALLIGASLGDAIHALEYQGGDLIVAGIHAKAWSNSLIKLPAPQGNTDIFVASLGTDLASNTWTASLGQGQTDAVHDIASDSQGRVAVAGELGSNACLAGLDAGAVSWQQSITMGAARGVAAAGSSTYYFVGEFSGTPPAIGVSAVGQDGFLIRVDKP